PVDRRCQSCRTPTRSTRGSPPVQAHTAGLLLLSTAPLMAARHLPGWSLRDRAPRPWPIRSASAAMSCVGLDSDLIEDGVHQPGREGNLTIWNRWGSAGRDALIEPLDQFLHARVLIEPLARNRSCVMSRISEVLARGIERGH